MSESCKFDGHIYDEEHVPRQLRKTQGKWDFRLYIYEGGLILMHLVSKAYFFGFCGPFGYQLMSLGLLLFFALFCCFVPFACVFRNIVFEF